jgi:hypothetical protein
MNRCTKTIDRALARKVCGLTAPLLAAFFLLPVRSYAQTGKETLERPDGRRVAGRIEGDTSSGFRFVPTSEGSGGRVAVALEPNAIIHFEGSVADPLASSSPFHVLVGVAARLSGSLRELTRDSVRLGVGRQVGDVTLPRGCVQAIVQHPGEALVLAETFESLDPTRWTITGKPEPGTQSRQGERRSLRLPAEGASLTHILEEPLAAGRLELAFEDDGTIAAGRECVVEPTFRGKAGRSVIRIILGWSEESLAVESPSGPALPVQRLARAPGWHRLTLRFGPEQMEISVDGKELAHGKGPDGPLTSVRLATQGGGPAPRRPLDVRFQDLQLFRFAEPPASLEIDVTQDEARLVVGDQLYGEVREADSRQLVMAVDGNPVSLRWSDVSGLYFRRMPLQSASIEGLLARVEWRPTPGDRADDLDFAEGALLTLSSESVTLATPYTGVLAIPRRELRRIVVLGRGRRFIIDSSTHHLGDEISVTVPLFDPPRPEGLVLDRTIELTQPADRPVELSLDVLQVIPEAGETEYSRQVRNGELRTYVAINGHRFDYLNRYIKTPNEVPERIRIPIPRGLLRTGPNALRIEVTGTTSARALYDDLGILQIALEFPE